jgi:2-hydroxy-6-oxonona-2,4-dienedioate hydrolase
MVKTSGDFTYLEEGSGKPIILLHGLMGGVENFGEMVDFISNDFKVYGLDLKLFETPILKCSVKNKANSQIHETYWS